MNWSPWFVYKEAAKYCVYYHWLPLLKGCVKCFICHGTRMWRGDSNSNRNLGIDYFFSRRALLRCLFICKKSPTCLFWKPLGAIPSSATLYIFSLISLMLVNMVLISAFTKHFVWCFYYRYIFVIYTNSQFGISLPFLALANSRNPCSSVVLSFLFL